MGHRESRREIQLARERHVEVEIGVDVGVYLRPHHYVGRVHLRVVGFPAERQSEIPLVVERQPPAYPRDARPLENIERHGRAQLLPVFETVVGEPDSLIGASVHPVGTRSGLEAERVAQVGGQRQVDRLPGQIVAREERIGRTHVFRTEFQPDTVDEATAGECCRTVRTGVGARRGGYAGARVWHETGAGTVVAVARRGTSVGVTAVWRGSAPVAGAPALCRAGPGSRTRSGCAVRMFSHCPRSGTEPSLKSGFVSGAVTPFMSVSVSCVVPCGIFGRTRRALRRRLCRPGRRRFGRTVRCAGSGFDCRFGVGFCGFGGLRSVRFTGAGTACAGRTADWFINRTVDLIEICCRGFRCCRIAAAVCVRRGRRSFRNTCRRQILTALVRRFSGCGEAGQKEHASRKKPRQSFPYFTFHNGLSPF